MFFRNIIGHEDLKSKLIQTVNENRVSHAWLFFGKEGSGALSLALAFAQYIFCLDKTFSDSCGECSGCKKVSKLIHPDLHFVFPVNKTKNTDKDIITSDDFINEWRKFLIDNPYGHLTQWYDFIELDNKQGIINTEESKRLAGKLSLKSFESEYKVVIIWLPEKMNDQASNKLLKLLEEPPAMTVFLLVSENPDQLLSTIKSRCLPVKVPQILDKDLEEYLKNSFNINSVRAQEIIRISEGNILKAKELLEEETDDLYFIKFRDLMRSGFKGNIKEILLISEEIADYTREKQKKFLEYSLNIIRQSMVLHFDKDDLMSLSGQEKEFTMNFAPFINERNLIPFVGEINKAIFDIEHNANSRIVLLDLGLKLSSLIKVKTG